MNALKTRYEQHFLPAESAFGVVLAGALALLTQFSGWWTADQLVSTVSGDAGNVYQLVVTLSITLLGFVLTAVSVVLAWTGLEKFQVLRKSRHYHTLYDVFFSAIRWLAILGAVAFVGIFVESLVIVYLLAATLTVSALRIWRCIWALRWVTRIGTTRETT